MADLRAPTPSAAAELVTTDMSGVVAKLKNALAGLTYEENKRLDMYYTNTTNRVLKLKNTLDLELNQHNNTLMHYKQNMNVFIDNVLQENAYKMALNLNTLDKLNPLAILKKGYSQLLKDGKSVTTTADLNVGDDIDLRLYKGEAKARILEIKE